MIWALYSLLGALWLAARRSSTGLLELIPLAGGTFGLGLIAFAYCQALWLSLILMVLVGGCFMVMAGSSNTLLQTLGLSRPDDGRSAQSAQDCEPQIIFRHGRTEDAVEHQELSGEGIGQR